MGGTLEKYVFALVFIFLFSLGIIMYATTYATDNSAEISINNDTSIQGINSSIQSDKQIFLTESNTSSQVSTLSTLAQGSSTTNTGSQFKLSAFRKTIGSIFDSANSNIFGGDPTFKIIFSVISGLLILLLVFYGYKAWIGGQPS